MARRNLTKGQLAIVAAKVLPKARTASERGAMKGKKLLDFSIAFPMVDPADLSRARVIVEHAPLLRPSLQGDRRRGDNAPDTDEIEFLRET
jgi:hypothetical protein